MRKASPIPIETPTPRHRGAAYTKFELTLEELYGPEFQIGLLKGRKEYVKCVSINFYPEGSPQDEE